LTSTPAKFWPAAEADAAVEAAADDGAAEVAVDGDELAALLQAVKMSTGMIAAAILRNGDFNARPSS
jgi:hypothetical protein